MNYYPEVGGQRPEGRGWAGQQQQDGAGWDLLTQYLQGLMVAKPEYDPVTNTIKGGPERYPGQGYGMQYTAGTGGGGGGGTGSGGSGLMGSAAGAGLGNVMAGGSY